MCELEDNRMNWLNRIREANNKNFHCKELVSDPGMLRFAVGDLTIQIHAATECVTLYDAQDDMYERVYTCFDKEEAVSRGISALGRAVYQQDEITDDELEELEKLDLIGIYDMNFNYPLVFHAADVREYATSIYSGDLANAGERLLEKMDTETVTNMAEKYDVLIGRSAVMMFANYRILEEERNHPDHPDHMDVFKLEERTLSGDMKMFDDMEIDMRRQVPRKLCVGHGEIASSMFLSGKWLAETEALLPVSDDLKREVFVLNSDLNREVWSGEGLINADDVRYFSSIGGVFEKYQREKDCSLQISRLEDVAKIIAKTPVSLEVGKNSYGEYNRMTVGDGIFYTDDRGHLQHKNENQHLDFRNQHNVYPTIAMQTLASFVSSEGNSANGSDKSNMIAYQVEDLEDTIYFRKEDVAQEAAHFFPTLPKNEAMNSYIDRMDQRVAANMLLNYPFIYQSADRELRSVDRNESMTRPPVPVKGSTIVPTNELSR